MDAMSRHSSRLRQVPPSSLGMVVNQAPVFLPRLIVRLRGAGIAEVSISRSFSALDIFSDLYSRFASLIDSLWESMSQVVSFRRESERCDVPLREVVEDGAWDFVGSGSARPQVLIGSFDRPLSRSFSEFF